jgi:hypothetical protein
MRWLWIVVAAVVLLAVDSAYLDGHIADAGLSLLHWVAGFVTLWSDDLLRPLRPAVDKSGINKFFKDRSNTERFAGSLDQIDLVRCSPGGVCVTSSIDSLEVKTGSPTKTKRKDPGGHRYWITSSAVASEPAGTLYARVGMQGGM